MSELLDRHRALLDDAIAAVGRRDHFAPFVESLHEALARASAWLPNEGKRIVSQAGTLDLESGAFKAKANVMMAYP